MSPPSLTYLPTICRRSIRISSTLHEHSSMLSTSSSEAINPPTLCTVPVPAPLLLTVLTPLHNVPSPLPPYTNYRWRTPPASAAHPRTPPTPYRPVTPQEPPTEDSGTLPDARNRSPSILGWDTYIGNRQTARSANPFHTRRSPSPDRRHTRSLPFHHHRGNLASANSFHTR